MEVSSAALRQAVEPTGRKRMEAIPVTAVKCGHRVHPYRKRCRTKCMPEGGTKKQDG